MVEFAKNGTGTMDETANVKRIAMWSGPQNISTALMRSWGNRSDCYVSDTPLYAYYLQQTGADDLGRDQTLAAHDADWRRVVGWLTGCVPRGRSIWYQKDLAHHMLPEVGRREVAKLTARGLGIGMQKSKQRRRLTSTARNPLRYQYRCLKCTINAWISTTNCRRIRCN